ncbi:hypothetical protein SELMODRAFT_417211 [Selaginella moellendorffii]|uniref:Uncharacterized protein n=1 Tax=Selaginella moellendorffii TaxID=88036 RepID=D8S1R1_SELML|nr:hypothetical protein SELMODRAFT_417211 [Selaginella moellendorffii]
MSTQPLSIALQPQHLCICSTLSLTPLKPQTTALNPLHPSPEEEALSTAISVARTGLILECSDIIITLCHNDGHPVHKETGYEKTNIASANQTLGIVGNKIQNSHRHGVPKDAKLPFLRHQTDQETHFLNQSIVRVNTTTSNLANLQAKSFINIVVGKVSVLKAYADLINYYGGQHPLSLDVLDYSFRMRATSKLAGGTVLGHHRFRRQTIVRLLSYYRMLKTLKQLWACLSVHQRLKP